jgi:hypothetical protein
MSPNVPGGALPSSVSNRRSASVIATALAAVALSATAVTATAAEPSVVATVAGGVLEITGSQGSDRITLRLAAQDPTALQVDVRDDGSADFTFDRATFARIAVDGGDGDDSVRIAEANGVFTTTEATRVEGGNGDDSFIGGSGAELFVGGRGDDFTDGNAGVDTALLGQGDDTFVWDPGDASDTVDGGAGADTLVFNGAGGNEVMAATADAGRVLFTRVQGAIVMDLDGVEAIDVNALGGVDLITVNDVTGTDLRRVNVDLAAALGGTAADRQADVVTVVGTSGDDTIAAAAAGGTVNVTGLTAGVRITGADADLDTLSIDSRGGDDAVTVDPDVENVIQVAVQ